MLVENAIHSQQVYDPTDDSIMAEQELCMERLYDYNHTRPSEHVKRARLFERNACRVRSRLRLQPKKNRKFPLGNSLPYLSRVDFCRVCPGGRTLFLLSKRSKLYPVHRPYQTASSVPESGGD